MRHVFCRPALFALALFLPGLATADPLPGRDILKFSQSPMLATPIPVGPTVPAFEIFRGHNELSTAYGRIDVTGAPPSEYRGVFMADDFADRFSSPVVHVKWWGSYMNVSGTAFPVPRFLISFEEDIPTDPNNGIDFSRPGKPLLNQVVKRDPLFPGSGTFTEKPVGFSFADGPTYEYNAELHLGKEFRQKPDTVYWLKIVALYDVSPNNLPDPLPQWGWHNRDYTIHNPLASVPPGVVPGESDQAPVGIPFPIWHFQDDAVTGLVQVLMDPQDPMSQIMPLVQQREYRPTHYDGRWDGPSFIQRFSKDLAFELYTIPEPAGLALAMLAMVGGMMAFRRR